MLHESIMEEYNTITPVYFQIKRLAGLGGIFVGHAVVSVAIPICGWTGSELQLLGPEKQRKVLKSSVVLPSQRLDNRTIFVASACSGSTFHYLMATSLNMWQRTKCREKDPLSELCLCVCFAFQRLWKQTNTRAYGRRNEDSQHDLAQECKGTKVRPALNNA